MSEGGLDWTRASGSELDALIMSMRAEAAFSQRYFEAVRDTFAQDAAQARELASRWSIIHVRPDRDGYSLRTRSVFERLNGEWEASAASAILAGRCQKNRREKFIFQLSAIDALGRASQFVRARRLAQALRKGLLEINDKVGAARAAINGGNAALWGDHHVQARQWFESAIELCSDSEAEFELGSALLGLSTCLIYLGEIRSAQNAAERALSIFDSNGLGAYSSLCRMNLALTNLFSGYPDWAASELRKLKTEGELASIDRARVEELLGDAYVRLNLLDEASDAFATAETLQQNDSHSVQLANLALGRGEIEALRGRKDAALSAFEEAAERYELAENTLWRHVVDAKIARLEWEHGNAKLAADLAAQARAGLTITKSKRFAAEAALTEALALASLNQLGVHAPRLVHRKVKSARAADLEWQLAYLKAKVRKGESAKAAFRHMVRLILSQRTLIRSTVVRASFLHDKAQAIGEYLDLLFTEGSPAAIREATQVLDSIQSATFIDELLAQPNYGSPGTRERLQTLRQNYAASLDTQLPGGPERRLHSGLTQYSELKRNWVEWSTEVLEAPTAPPQVHARADTVRWVETPGGLFVVSEGQFERLQCSPNELRSLLRWLQFELASPQVGQTETSDALTNLLAKLSQHLRPRTVDVGDRTFLPSGIFWQVPWACLAESWSLKPPALRLVSGSKSTSQQAVLLDRAALWYQPQADLPHIEKEAETFLAQFPKADVFQSINAIEDCLQEGDYDVLHIACHANHVESSPMFSSMMFDGGSVPAVDIAHSRLRARHVVLSACRTSVFGSSFGHEPNGLARAFLARGAQTVVASQWALNDEAAALGMSAFYATRLGGGSASEAVGAFQRKVREKFDHPHFWAPLVALEGY